jgi:hypothetical protein
MAVTSTLPSVHTARRRIARYGATFVGTSGSSGATGMQSVTSSTPSGVSNVVTNTLVSRR